MKAGMLLEGDSGKGLLSPTRCDSETEWPQIPAAECRAHRQHGNQDEHPLWEMLMRQGPAEGFQWEKCSFHSAFSAKSQNGTREVCARGGEGPSRPKELEYNEENDFVQLESCYCYDLEQNPWKKEI